MNHPRGLVGLILILALAIAACGSATSTSMTVRVLGEARPGQPVPAWAVKRLTAIADRAVTLNGGHPVAWATAVVTTNAKALTSAAHASAPGANAIVYLVTIMGHFVCNLCSGPPGSRAPTGTYLSLIINARTFEGTGSGIGPEPPAVSPAQLGPVTYLKVHPLTRR